MSSAVLFDVAVIGLGYVGLPLVLEASRAGLRVLGLDTNPEKVEALERGQSHVEDVSDEEIQAALDAGFQPSTHIKRLAYTQAAIICVPTPLRDQVPDLTHVIEAGRAVGRYMQPYSLVVLQSTSFPGTTTDVLQPLLEEESGLKAGTEFYLAYAPERIDPGNPQYGLRNTPKLLAGINEESADVAAELFQRLCDDVVIVASPREAEMAKLLENTYRHVNIALMNEMAVFCRELGIDIWEVIRAASTKPFGFQAFFPGPGVGGHCIPVDPRYLSFRVGQLGYPFRFVELAQEINARMPVYVVTRGTEMLNTVGKSVKDSDVLLLGVAYKPEVSDTRESPAEPIVRKLRELGARLSFVDPHVERFVVDGAEVTAVDESAVADADLVLLLTPHQAFDLELLASKAPLMLDTRGSVPDGLCERL